MLHFNLKWSTSFDSLHVKFIVTFNLERKLFYVLKKKIIRVHAAQATARTGERMHTYRVLHSKRKESRLLSPGNYVRYFP